MRSHSTWPIHAVLLFTAALTLLPFAVLVNNAFRSTPEFYHGFFALPASVRGLAQVAGHALTGDARPLAVRADDGAMVALSRPAAFRFYLAHFAVGPERAWRVLRPYVLNSFIVSGLTAIAVCCLGSGTAYILARYRFLGGRFVFLFILATMVFPGVLTLVPSFLLVRELGLLNSYAAMILPYVAGGQVFAIFVFKSFFEGLSEELFESARLDGAGHWHLYWHIVLPLSRPIFAVVAIMNVLGTWNNFLWPFIVNTDDRHSVVASGLFTLSTSSMGGDVATMFAAYLLSSLPLLVLFIYANKPFVRGLTSGALKV
ncbi:MAG: carbohydrate ABC transporter permease [Opitutales bacterium]